MWPTSSADSISPCWCSNGAHQGQPKTPHTFPAESPPWASPPRSKGVKRPAVLTTLAASLPHCSTPQTWVKGGWDKQERSPNPSKQFIGWLLVSGHHYCALADRPRKDGMDGWGQELDPPSTAPLRREPWVKGRSVDKFPLAEWGGE